VVDYFVEYTYSILAIAYKPQGLRGAFEVLWKRKNALIGD
jgi:hypothetical protein